MSFGNAIFKLGKKIFDVFPQKPLFSLFSRKIFKILDFLWPKEKNLLVFSGTWGNKFSDNSKFLFLKFVDNYSNEFRIVWITGNTQLIKKINPDDSKKFRVIYQYSLEGLLALLRAKVIFYVMGEEDIPFTSFSQRTVTVQLWHGIPLKKIGKLELHNEGYFSSVIRYLNKSVFTHWICSSSIDRIATALCVGLPIERVVITGLPRNDYLIEQKSALPSDIAERYPYLKKKIILYAPTFRDTKKVQFFPFSDLSFEDINNVLERNDAYLLIRGHWADDLYERHGKLDYKPLTEGSRIITANHEEFEDVQELLPFVDILISDYSSIWIDFLLLDRPIIFVPYDLEEYCNERGLLYDYNSITPGPKILTNREFIEAIQTYIENPEKDSDKRICVKKIFHEYEDGLSYKRIYEIIKEKIR
jgi:CDP-glycerol glycerophosphotransferase (TagB/SpsB family)